MRTLALVMTLLALPGAAGAQQAPDDTRWSAWLGCWELALEDAGRVPPITPERREPSTPSRTATALQVCVDRAAGGATFSTRVGSQAPIEQTVIADGREHPMTDGDCHGQQRTEWSRDGRRLYANADLTCPGDRGRRQVSGLSILGANGTWTDIQAVDISGQQTVRVRRYRRVSEERAAGRAVRTPLSIAEVKEAASKVSPRALEAALVETGSTFDLSGRELIALQDAQVPPSVTDLMIALSYPEKFVVERQTRTDLAPPLLIDDPFMAGWAFGYPTWSDFYGFYSPLYGSYSPYFYSPFSYSYLRTYDPRFLGGGGFVIVGDGSSGGSGSIRPSGTGRVINGQGYTRVRSREAETRTSSSSTGRVSTSSASSSSSGSSSSSSSGGGGSSVSSQGFSSGGGGGDGGRTAQPR